MKVQGPVRVAQTCACVCACVRACVRVCVRVRVVRFHLRMLLQIGKLALREDLDPPPHVEHGARLRTVLLAAEAEAAEERGHGRRVDHQRTDHDARGVEEDQRAGAAAALLKDSNETGTIPERAKFYRLLDENPPILK